MNVAEKLQACIDTLNEIKESGYWPFASPAPCSTEVRIKNCINWAEDNLTAALGWHELMFGNTGRDPMKVASTKIVQLN